MTVAAASERPNRAAFVHFEGGREIDYGGFPKVPGDAKGKQPFAELVKFLPKGPVRLRIGKSSKALAMLPCAGGLSPDAMEIAKPVTTAAYRKDALAWLNYALARQRPLLVAGPDEFVVLPRVDRRWADEPQSAAPGGDSRVHSDGLATALLALADRLIRVPALAEDAAAIRANMTTLHGDANALVGEFGRLGAELRSTTEAMGQLAEQIGAVTTDVKFALEIMGRRQ